MSNKKRKKIRWLIILGSLFLILNLYVAMQAYNATHFKVDADKKSLLALKDLSTIDLVKMVVFGIEIARPETSIFPEKNYESITIDVGNGEHLSGWLMHTDSVNKGIVVYFHGYKGEKSMLLDHAYQTLNLGYDALLIDFSGSGYSSGNQTTLGYNEASDVKVVYDYVSYKLNEQNIYFLGFSMGAAAIMKAQHDYDLHLTGIILEASYGRMIDTIRIRMRQAGLLSYPLSYLFAFWGGAANGFNAFDMNPEEYAKSVTVPTLIACGDSDPYISKDETQRMYDNLKSEIKMLRFYPKSQHESYLEVNQEKWTNDITEFLDLTNSSHTSK